MDLRRPTPIGERIDAAFDQLQWAGGYDHNWVVRGTPGLLRPAARACCEKNGVVLEVRTTLPGIQFYTGNYLGGSQMEREGPGTIAAGAFAWRLSFSPMPLPVLLFRLPFSGGATPTTIPRFFAFPVWGTGGEENKSSDQTGVQVSGVHWAAYRVGLCCA